MTMNGSSASGMKAEINVTPMIDVLLVLLIIFMVIVPALPRGEAVTAPQPARSDAVQPESTVVLEVFKGLGGQVGYRINRQDVARQDLPARLARIYENRAQRVLFVKGDDDVNFAQVAEAIDIGHAAGIDRIGMMTPKVQAGM
jgi:biopolymer transport protein ExbD